MFVIKSKYRDNLQGYLQNNNIQTLIHYPIPPHKQEAYSIYSQLQLPIAETLSREVLSLPISSQITQEELTKVIIHLNQF